MKNTCEKQCSCVKKIEDTVLGTVIILCGLAVALAFLGYLFGQAFAFLS